MTELTRVRPADCGGRLEKEVKCYEFSDGLNVEYDRVNHAPAMTMEDCEAVDEALDVVIHLRLQKPRQLKTQKAEVKQ